MNGLYTIFCRYDGLLFETALHEERDQRQLVAELDATTLDDIRRHKAALPLPDTILDRMLELKEQRLEELARTQKRAPTNQHSPTVRQDAEPEQGA